MAYPYPIFSSPNQAVDSLFGREFGTYQFGEQLNEADAQRALQRDAIAAQQALAMAQLKAAQQQQETANMFRIEEAKARRDQLDRTEKLERERLGVEKAYKEGLLKKPDSKTQAQMDEEDRASEALASQWQAYYDSQLASQKCVLEADKKKKMDEFWGLGAKGRANTVKEDYDAQIKALPDKIFRDTVAAMAQYAPPGYVYADFPTKKFLSRRKTGSAAVPGGQPPGGTESPGTGTGENAPPVPFQLQGTPAPMTVPPSNIPGGARPIVWPGGGTQVVNPNMFAPGTTTLPPSITPPPPTNFYTPPTTAPPALVYGPEAPTDVVGLPREWVPQASPYVPPITDRVQVRLPYGLLDMSVADAQEMERQLRAVPPAQRAALATAIKNQLLNSGRAKFIVTRP